MMNTRIRKSLFLLTAISLFGLMGAKGEGCGGDGAAFSQDDAPDMSGTWDVNYDDRLDVEITIGGAVYTEQLGAQGGTVEINHEGQPLTFNLDCQREEVVCPSEVWPEQVSFRQDDETYPHRVWMQTPYQECSGEMIDPEPSECGDNTPNPDCDQVCDGEVVTGTHESFGVINNEGDNFRLALGVGLASNGVNCVLAGGSYVDGGLATAGTAENEDWEATSSNGDVITIYSGGCLWAGDPNMDGELEALVLGATVRFASGYQANRQLPPSE